MLNTWQRLDRRVKAASKRVAERPDEHGIRASASIDELTKLARVIDELIDEETIHGREQGAPWGLLGSSKQAAAQRYAKAKARRK